MDAPPPQPGLMQPFMQRPQLFGLERYEFVRDIGSGNFGVARLNRDKLTNEPVAIKFIDRGERVGAGAEEIRISSLIAMQQTPRHGKGTPRGLSEHWMGSSDGWPMWIDRAASSPLPAPSPQVDKNVEREILNHRLLNHPNIIAFKEVSMRSVLARIVPRSGTRYGPMGGEGG
jgi:serine/threonine protein kinase